MHIYERRDKPACHNSYTILITVLAQLSWNKQLQPMQYTIDSFYQTANCCAKKFPERLFINGFKF